MRNVYVVDDSELVRERLIDMLSDVEEVRIIGATGDPEEAMAEIRILNPHAVILDIRMPGKSGIEVLREIKKDEPSPVVIILTNYPYPQYQKELFSQQIDGIQQDRQGTEGFAAERARLKEKKLFHIVS